DQRDRGVRHGLELRSHTTRGINHQPETDRDLFAVDVVNRLFDLVFINTEILFLQIEDRNVVLINHCDVEINQIGVCSDHLSFIHYLLVSLRALSLRAFPVLRVFRLLSLSRLWWSWRGLGARASGCRE